MNANSGLQWNSQHGHWQHPAGETRYFQAGGKPRKDMPYHDYAPNDPRARQTTELLNRYSSQVSRESVPARKAAQGGYQLRVGGDNERIQRSFNQWVDGVKQFTEAHRNDRTNFVGGGD